MRTRTNYSLAGAGRLRIHDLVAKTAHVRLKDTLRVLIALRAVAREYDLEPATILHMPYATGKPTQEESQQCETAYLGMYEGEELGKLLFEIEQLV